MNLDDLKRKFLTFRYSLPSAGMLVAVAMALSLAIAITLLRVPVGEPFLTTGVVESATTTHSEFGSKFYLSVRLADGVVVRARLAQRSIVNVGAVVEIRGERRAIGPTRYAVVRYE